MTDIPQDPPKPSIQDSSIQDTTTDTFAVIDGGAPPPRRDRAPRKTRKAPHLDTMNKRGPRTPSSTPDYHPGVIGAGIANTWGQFGMLVGMIDPHCGGLFVTNAKQMGEAMEKLAKTNPAVRQFLLNLISTSVIGEVIAAHFPVFAGIAMHHIPAARAKMEAASALTEENLKKMSGQSDA